jgi:hypothetical protein
MKKPYTIALCIKNDIGYERVLIIGKEYEIISRTNRYITVKTEIGNIQSIWKGYFHLLLK